MPIDVVTGRSLLSCQACGARTEVTPHVHADVPLNGMRVRCWSCGAPFTIPPTPGTVDYERRQLVDLGMFMIAAGACEQGKAILHASERLRDEP